MSAPAPAPAAPFKVLMAPMNFADQPMALVRALRRRGVTADHLQYSALGLHPLGYALDRVARHGNSDFVRQLEVLEEHLSRGYDIFHFWQRSLLFGTALDGLTGLDLPIIKARGARLFHRFTGFDLRMPSLDARLNPHSPFHHGYQSPFDERAQQAYIAMLRDYVDRFFVQDPEMGQFMPEAEILPRGLELEHWQPVGVRPNPRPLVVHAPSNAAVKGSNYVVRALETLRHEGLAFDFQLLDRVPHAEAREWYRRADIIVDQILIGATGVLTLEAWALAKPCVTYLRRDLFEPFYGVSELPVANATPDTIEGTLRRLIADFDWRAELASKGRAMVEQHHDIERIATRYAALCEASLADRTASREATRALAFFRPRLAAAIAPELPKAALGADQRPALRRLARVEAVVRSVELAAMRGLLRAQALAFRAVGALLARLVGRRRP